ncbi:MAG: hypothetical protein IPG61_04770 [bacterium]|jgi:hypothetical protein|nr:hypothetical protein [bacterium]MBK7670049.1 hypothetical protein [bacterium]
MRSPVLAGVLTALVLGAAAASALADDSGPATFTDALALAQQQNKVLVIDFYTDW